MTVTKKEDIKEEKGPKLIYFWNFMGLYELMAFCCTALDTIYVNFMRKKVYTKHWSGPIFVI